jgi:molybdate transport system substrate-binding protein
LCAQNKTLAIAAASDLQFALAEIAPAFEKQTGYKLNLVFGSSGNLAAQIENGAPYDIFMSADMDYPAKLAATGSAGVPAEYALGQLALWVTKASALDPGRGLEVLSDAAVGKVAIANPAHAPYGRLAVSALRAANLYDKLAGRLVLGENVSQAAQFAASGNAQAALISLSLAQAPNMRQQGRHWAVPGQLLEQGIALTARARANGAASQFVRFLLASEGQAILRRHGFLAPGGKQ